MQACADFRMGPWIGNQTCMRIAFGPLESAREWTGRGSRTITPRSLAHPRDGGETLSEPCWRTDDGTKLQAPPDRDTCLQSVRKKRKIWKHAYVAYAIYIVACTLTVTDTYGVSSLLKILWHNYIHFRSSCWPSYRKCRI